MKTLDRKFCVAPMMQYTDMHDRFLLRLISKKIFLYTEMITTGSLIYGDCFDRLEFNSEEHPVGVQLGGSNIADLTECSKKCEQFGYDEINLNVGCPSDRVQKGRFGACLMLEPNFVAECLSSMDNSVTIPVSIKCRLGVDNNEDYEETGEDEKAGAPQKLHPRSGFVGLCPLLLRIPNRHPIFV